MIINMKSREEQTNGIEDEAATKAEVTILNSGSPILKVELGTTLKVVKLLCETVQLNRNEILGVKPKTSSHCDIPCVVTLDETKLDQNVYELIVAEASSEKSDDSKKSNETIKCENCLNESNHNKSFTTIGTNTELDISELQRKPKAECYRNDEGDGENDTLRSLFRSSKECTLGRKHDPLVIDGSYLKNGKTSLHDERNSYDHSPKDQHADKLMLKKELAYLHKPFKDLPHYIGSHHSYHSLFEHARNSYNISPTNTYKSKIYDKHSSYMSKQDSLSPRRYSSGYHYHHIHPTYSHSYHQSDYKRSKWGGSSRHYDYAQEYLKIGDKPIKEEHPKKVLDVPPSLIHVRSNSQNDHKSQHIHEQASLSPQKVDEPPVFVLPNDFDINSDAKLQAIDKQSLNNNNNDEGTFSLQKFKEIEETSYENFEIDQKVHRESPRSGIKPNSPVANLEENNDSPDSSTNVEHKLHCKICNSSFTTKSLLYKHLRGHTSDEKPFKCSECGQGFTLSSNLRQHRIIHRGYKPFQCEFCGKKFMRSNVYKQHRRIHTGEEMHKCTLCPSEFLQKYALVKHMKKNHNIDASDM